MRSTYEKTETGIEGMEIKQQWMICLPLTSFQCGPSTYLRRRRRGVGSERRSAFSPLCASNLFIFLPSLPLRIRSQFPMYFFFLPATMFFSYILLEGIFSSSNNNKKLYNSMMTPVSCTGQWANADTHAIRTVSSILLYTYCVLEWSKWKKL